MSFLFVSWNSTRPPCELLFSCWKAACLFLGRYDCIELVHRQRTQVSRWSQFLAHSRWKCVHGNVLTDVWSQADGRTTSWSFAINVCVGCCSAPWARLFVHPSHFFHVSSGNNYCTKLPRVHRHQLQNLRVFPQFWSVFPAHTIAECIHFTFRVKGDQH